MITIQPLQDWNYFNPEAVLNVQNCTGKRPNLLHLDSRQSVNPLLKLNRIKERNWGKKKKKGRKVEAYFLCLGVIFGGKSIRVSICECGNFPKVKHWESVTDKPQQRPLEVIIFIKPTSSCVDKLKAFIISRSPWEIMKFQWRKKFYTQKMETSAPNSMLFIWRNVIFSF